ncbi:hypothetical protein RUA4292_01597 [Ruegeria atlantica]|uniref:Uncharacterized protein n=1 Tax=Ruegeria atlantica TaxID=81569 RepID=A0A0P1F038_9RHOB|nr:hypothetical protein RUA4292_01597 [Ruegeria atlantica]
MACLRGYFRVVANLTLASVSWHPIEHYSKLLEKALPCEDLEHQMKLILQ